MNKFFWFLGGCATGLLAAAAISVLNEDCSSSFRCDDDEDSELANYANPVEDAPIFPGENLKAASEFFSNTYPFGNGASDRLRTEEETPNASKPSNAPA